MVTETKFTPDTAKSFNRYSGQNVAHIKNTLSCGCEPYKDVFTYARWQALGYQVKRGEHSVTIPVIVERENDNNTVSKRLFNGHVFCRCQVKSKTGNEPVTPIQPEVKPVVIQPIIEPVNSKQPECNTDKIMNGWRII